MPDLKPVKLRVDANLRAEIYASTCGRHMLVVLHTKTGDKCAVQRCGGRGWRYRLWVPPYVTQHDFDGYGVIRDVPAPRHVEMWATFTAFTRAHKNKPAYAKVLLRARLHSATAEAADAAASLRETRRILRQAMKNHVHAVKTAHVAKSAVDTLRKDLGR